MKAITLGIFLRWLAFGASEDDVERVPAWFAVLFCSFLGFLIVAIIVLFIHSLAVNGLHKTFTTP
jgi:hypothetical protein